MAHPDRLNVWLEAFDLPIGQIGRAPGGGVAFGYATDHLDDAAAVALSLSLPLTDQIYGDVPTRAFFDNLLQENDSLRSMMAREAIARDDLVSLLAILGADCTGAVSCLPEDAPPVKRPGDLTSDYDPLSDADLEKILVSLAETGAPPAETRDPSPVAGVQPKIAVALLPDGRFALPKPGVSVPTTHLIKTPRRRDGADARIEYFCTSLARLAGLSTATVAQFDRFGVQGLLIQRFDRIVDGAQIYRIHQEDFAQALSLPAELKYERRGRPGRMFDASAIATVLDRCAIPAEARERFIDLALFNLLIGNVDNHAKNHALLFDQASAPVLAPAYDLLATRLDARLTDELAFRIGAANTLAEITIGDLKSFLAALGLRGRGAERLLAEKVRALIDALASEATLAELTSEGLKRLADHIGHAAGHLVDALNLAGIAVPERDAFISRGGGWLTS